MRNPRWLISFADLCLLLLGCFVLLHASGNRAAATASVRQAFGSPAASDAREYRAAALFEPGEAMLRPAALRELTAAGARAAAGHRQVRIESGGTEPATARLDDWELSAARAAAAARAIAAGGLSPDRIDIAMVPADGARPGQILRVSTTR